jgi:hypothetical protein
LLGNFRRRRPIEEWAEIIGKCIPAFKSIFVILDGLDECENQRTERQIINLMQSLQTKGVKVLITSCHKDVPTGLDAEIFSFESRDSDIRTYVETELMSFDHDEATRKTVVATIVREAQTW